MDIALVYSAAVAAALPLVRVGVPPAVGYMAVGALLGPGALAVVADPQAITPIADIGIALMLFSIGLELSPERLRSGWRAMATAGSLQLGLTGVAVYGLAALSGAATATALAWSFVAALSSTAIGLRVLQDRQEAASPHGQVVTGVLLLQDLAVIPMMLLLGVMGANPDVWGIVGAVGTALGALAVTALGARVLVPRIFALVEASGSRELFLLAVLAVTAVIGTLAAAAGLSLAVGAFVAGVVLADGHFSHRALKDIVPLRTATTCLFFVSMGMLVDARAVVAAPALAAAGLAVAVVLKGTCAGLAARAAGLPTRAALWSGLLLGQLGEFSLLLAAQAQASGVLGEADRALITVVGVASMLLTPLVAVFVPKEFADSGSGEVLLNLPDGDARPRQPILIAGWGLAGQAVGQTLLAGGAEVAVIDTNPRTVAALRESGLHGVYGNAAAADVLAAAGLARARGVVVAVSSVEAAHEIAEAVALERPELPVILRIRWADDPENAVHGPAVTVISEERAGSREMVAAALARFLQAPGSEKTT